MPNRTHQHPADAAIAARLAELRLEWKDLYANSGVSQETVRKLRSGAAARPKTEAKVEDALGWEHGSLQAVRDGRMPAIAGRREGHALGLAPPVAADYPPDVAGNPFLERIWDDPYAPEDQRRAAVDGVIAHLARARESRGAARGEGKRLRNAR